MKLQEIGAMNAVVSKITTLPDGGTRISIDLTQEDIQVIQKLLSGYVNGENNYLITFFKNIDEF